MRLTCRITSITLLVDNQITNDLFVDRKSPLEPLGSLTRALTVRHNSLCNPLNWYANGVCPIFHFLDRRRWCNDLTIFGDQCINASSSSCGLMTHITCIFSSKAPLPLDVGRRSTSMEVTIFMHLIRNDHFYARTIGLRPDH